MGHRTGCFGVGLWAYAEQVTTDPAAVTCKGCRRSLAFRTAEGFGAVSANIKGI